MIIASILNIDLAINPKSAQKFVSVWIIAITTAVIFLFGQACTAEDGDIEEGLRLSNEEFNSIKQFLSQMENSILGLFKKLGKY